MRKLVMATTLAALMVPGLALAQPRATTAPTAGPTVPSTAAAPTAAPAAAPTPAPRPAPLFWRQTLLNVSFSANVNTFNPGMQLTRNETVDMSISLRPRFTLSRMFQVRAGLDLSVEFTNSDSTTTLREPRFGDPFVDLWVTGIPAVGPVKFWVAPRLSFPVSPESRAQSRILTTGLILQAAVGVEHFLGGDLTIIANGTYLHNFNEFETPGLRPESFENRGYTPACFIDPGCTQQLSGLANVSDVMGWSLILAPSWGIFSPGLFFRMQHVFPYTFADLPGSSPGVQNPNRVRNNTFFAAWLDVNPNPWFSFEVGYSMGRNLLRADGTYGNPIWDPEQDMRLYVSTVFTLDKLYQVLSGAERGGGGVIRTQNNPRRGVAMQAMF